MTRFAIADPPYLGRAVRWYGSGRGGADVHPDASVWDTPERHRELVLELRADYDGWAIACPPDALPLYLELVPDVRVLVWHRRNAPPSGARVAAMWEAVLIHIPPERRRRGSGLPCPDVLDAPAPRVGFAGAKPEAWSRWVLLALGVGPEDDVVDMFRGSGLVASVLEQRPLF